MTTLFTQPMMPCRTQCLIVTLALIAGCHNGGSMETSESQSTEATWLEQFDDVAKGRTDAIRMAETRVDDADLADIRQLAGLSTLQIDAGEVSDEGAKAIAGSTTITQLRLRESSLTNQGMEAIAEMEQLEYLNVPAGNYDDACLDKIARLPKLKMLRLGNARLTARCTDALRDHSTLRFVHLINVPMDDEAVRALASIATLESLYLDGAKVPDESLDWLFSERPDLHVHLDQAHHDADPNRHEH